MMEEVLFRGVIQGYLFKNFTRATPYSISLITSVLFALLHFTALTDTTFAYAFNQVVYAFFGGMIFSAVVFRTRNVWLAGVIHGILNLMSRSCTPVTVTEEPFSWGGYLVNLGTLILVLSPILVLSWILLRHQSIKRTELRQV
jgi:membrane protease YdiL (CAAX protease family)